MPHNDKERADPGLLLFSPAKLNLLLRVTGKRPDGYHELVTLIQAISLGDTLSLHASTADCFTCSDPSLPMNSDNLVVKAVELFRTETAQSRPISIHLDKRIPRQAGLGGGSSNAATTLWGLNALFQTAISNQQLMEWGAELGSDVPFFFSMGRALCTGRGETVRNLAPVPAAFELYHCPIGASTAEIFSHCKPEAITPAEIEEIAGAYHNVNPPIPVNDLEPITEALHSEVVRWRHSIPKEVFMTGSGSTYFSYQKSSTETALSVKSIARELVDWYYKKV